MIEATGLTKAYGASLALDDVDAALGPGEALALLGPNGAGKTTTVEILEGYRTRDAGRVSVLGIDAPPIAEATNQLIPSARAKVSMRLAPGQDPVAASSALEAHLRSHAPWGAEVVVLAGAGAAPCRVISQGPAFDAIRRAFSDAWEVTPVEQGAGGTIPLVAAFMERYPDASLLLTGAGDPTSNPHSENESVDLDELERAIVAEALFMGYVAGDT